MKGKKYCWVRWCPFDEPHKIKVELLHKAWKFDAMAKKITLLFHRDPSDKKHWCISEARTGYKILKGLPRFTGPQFDQLFRMIAQFVPVWERAKDKPSVENLPEWKEEVQ